MAEFYLWSNEVSYFVTLTLALGVLSQAVTAALCFYRHPRNRVRILESLLEAAVLASVFVCSLLQGARREAWYIGILVPTGFGGWRVALFATIVILAAAIVILSRKPAPLSAVVLAGLTLPIMETVTGNAFAYIYIAAILLWLARSVFLNIRYFREVRTGFSALSIKQSIDSLPAGVMFCEKDGYILLINNQMQRLMTDISGTIWRNGRKFYGSLVLGNIDPRCQITWIGGENVVILPDGTAWKFALADVLVKKKVYTQITASDITDEWKLTVQLQPQNEELQKRQEELTSTIASLHLLSRERETQRAKMRAHDILGQRLTLMLRAIRSGGSPDYDLLRTLSQGVLDELKAAHAGPSPQDEIDALIQTFASIGVEILVDGSLPGDAAKGQLASDIIREAVTNAVRHGLATQVNIHMDDLDGDFHLRITDNGHPPAGPIREGGGLGGIRRKLEPFEGLLHIDSYPRFVLAVNIPGGDGA